jgi:hypothetical protein
MAESDPQFDNVAKAHDAANPETVPLGKRRWGQLALIWRRCRWR